MSTINDEKWLGIATEPTRQIAHTPFFLSRQSDAVPPKGHARRLNSQGYDRDNPINAIITYEAHHPRSIKRIISDSIIGIILDILTLFIPRLLSLSAGKNKQRIDQNVVLKIVREAVDKFPELKIRLSAESYDILGINDQLTFRKHMTVIRHAQHDYIVTEMAKAYPGHINQNAPTILYTGGRASGCLRILYCSVDEYVALYWSDWGLTSADSGAYGSHVYDYITEGNNRNWNAHYLTYNPEDFEITEPGEYTFLGRHNRKIWSFDGPCGMVDHGIGNVIPMAPFAIINNLTVTANFNAIRKLLASQIKTIAHEYKQRFKKMCGYKIITEKPISTVAENDLAVARCYFAPILKRQIPSYSE